MSLASNLLQLIFSLIVGIASLLGALFIIGFLLAVPRNDFEDDDHDITLPIFTPEDCPVQRGLGILPVECTVMDTGSRDFNSTACDNTVCEGCSEDENVICCCRNFSMTSFTFTCEGAEPRGFSQPDVCSCQPCDNVFVLLTFQVISSADGNILNNAMVNITDSQSTVPLNIDNAGFFNTFREVMERTIEVTSSAPGHLTQALNITILPPGPIQVVVILAAAVEESLGGNVDRPLSFDVGQLVMVGIPENTVVSLGELFEGNVTVRTIFFAMEQSTFSSEFPSEVTVNSGGALTFYTTRVLARTELLNENGDTLNISRSLSLNVNFSQFDPASGDTVTLLLYDESLDTWVEQSTFNITPITPVAGKRQAGEMSGAALLPSTDTFWAIALPVEQTDICYLQVRTFEGEDALNGVTVSVEQFINQLGDPFFFRSVGETDDGSGPVGHSACVEVLCGSVTTGTISAAFNLDTLAPSATQPNGLTINGSAVIFTSSTEGSPPSPFYRLREECIAADANTFVQFDVELEPPSSNIPPVEVPTEFWFVRAEVLGCFDSNRVSTISVNPTSGQASVFTTTVTETNDIVNIPTTISPGACNDQVTRRIACVEAYSNSVVTLQAELNRANTVSGDLCFLSELTDLLNNSVTRGVVRTDTTAVLNLTTITNGNTTAGLYFGDNRFATLDECLNPSSTDGIFAQFECFEHPADSLIVDLPAGCDETFTSQSCSQVPCSTDIGACTDGSGVQCCYREATNTDISITCQSYNTLTFSQPQTCFCMPCNDIIIDVIVTVTSSADGNPVMGANVDYAIPGDTTNDTVTDMLGMFTISQPISSGSVAFNITDTSHVMETHPPVDLIPPGPISISVVLRSRVTETRDPEINNVINVGGIANATLTGQFTGNVISMVSYIAAEMPRSFDTTLPPPVVTDGTFYAVRVIAATRLTDDVWTTVNSPANIQIMFTSTDMPNTNTTLSLLTFDNGQGVWNNSMMTLSSSPGLVTANATLTDTELPWAIGYPIAPEMICYVQVRTFRRDDNPLGNVEVEVLQLFEQFGQTFFFRSVAMTGDTSAAACLPVLCANDATIRAVYHVYLDANVTQPMGFTAAGQSVNKTTNSSNDNGPLFPSADRCSTAGNGQYVRFNLPIANPPPANIEPATNDDGFVFLRVSWYDCLESNQVFTVSSDSSSNILAIYGITVGEMGEIDDGLHSRVNERLIDYWSSGDMPVSCTDNPTADVTSRTACIQVEPNANITLQVELNPQSSMRETGNELCSLKKTIGSLMEADTSDNRLRFDLQELLSQFDPVINMTMLNDMGIYYDRNSANVAYTQCMNIPYSNSMAELYGSIAVFSCFTS